MAVKKVPFKESVSETEESLESNLRQEYEQRLEAWKAKELADYKEEEAIRIQEEVQKLFKKWEAEQKPPSLEEIRQLVDQEYVEIAIEIPVLDDKDEKQLVSFVIRELPQSIERRFYRQFKERLKQKGPEIAAFAQRNMDKPFEDVLQSFMNTFDGAFDVLADAVVLILNPFGKKPEITAEWATNNISSNRMFSIILAQIEVNRLRDFFSRLFQSGQRVGMMTTPLNIQQLQQLAR